MLSIHDVHARRGTEMAVKDVTLTVERGTWFGLIGANGSGKTTLLRAISGRLDLAGGTCIIGGEDLSRDRMRRAQRTGFAPTGEALPNSLTGGQILDLVARGATDPLRSLGAIGEALAIHALLDRRVGECSAGMRQRISIACAFAAGHEFVILDEPFNWLDPVAAYDLRLALRARVDAGLTLVTALHDLPTLAASCDAGVLLSGGRVALALDREALSMGRQDLGAFERHMIQVLRRDRLPSPAPGE
ncbi:ABC transporter ATP-binding protein [Sphingosinicella sp. BN140058]|nr:ABC transporter ATP-binding protein [Sphingosinicella sp. BN140058]